MLALTALLFVALPAANRHTVPRSHPRQNAVAPTLTVSGAVGKPHTWTNAELASAFADKIKPITYSLKGVAHTAHCLPLLAFLEAARPRTDPQIKHHALAFLVALRSSDGYTITLSLGELLPDYGNKEAYLALETDGKPLPADELPARLLLLGDAKPSRWIQGVSGITLVDGLKLLRKSGKRVPPPGSGQTGPTPPAGVQKATPGIS